MLEQDGDYSYCDANAIDIDTATDLAPSPSPAAPSPSQTPRIELFSPPQRSNITDFIDACKSLIEASSTLTYTKILKAIQDYVLSANNEDKVKVRMQLLECTAEYVMLMLGGNKYRQKRIKLIHSPAVATISSKTTTATIHNDKQQYNHIRQHFESKITINNSAPRNNKNIIVSNDQLRHCLPDNAFYDMADTTMVGKWGEELVYNYLSDKRKEAKITWMNKDVESKACYDLTIVCPIDVSDGNDINNKNNEITQGRRKQRWSTTFVEVKTTRFVDNNVFEITLWEYEFATANPKVPYHIYRVYNAGDCNKVYMVIIQDFFERIKEGTMKLCLAI